MPFYKKTPGEESKIYKINNYDYDYKLIKSEILLDKLNPVIDVLTIILK